MEFGDAVLWQTLKNRLYIVKQNLETLGTEGIPALELVILPLVERFESGERSEELYSLLIDVDKNS